MPKDWLMNINYAMVTSPPNLSVATNQKASQAPFTCPFTNVSFAANQIEPLVSHLLLCMSRVSRPAQPNTNQSIENQTQGADCVVSFALQ